MMTKSWAVGIEPSSVRREPKPSRPESRRDEPSLSERPSQARFKHGAWGLLRLRNLAFEEL